MGVKSKSGRIRRTSRKTAGGMPHERRRAGKRDAWDQGAREPEEIDFEIDCQRIVQEEAGRSPLRYYDEYN